MRKSAAVLAVLATALLVNNVAASPPSPSPPPFPGHGPVPAASLWEKPLGDVGIRIASASEAATPFKPDVPDIGQSPVGIFASDPQNAPPPGRAIAWSFHDADGPFVVTEDLRDATQAELEEPATHDPGCSAPDVDGDVRCYAKGFSIAEIRGGTRALVTAGDAVTAVTFFEEPSSGTRNAFGDYRNPVVTVTVMGPAESFTVEQALAVADAL